MARQQDTRRRGGSSASRPLVSRSAAVAAQRAQAAVLAAVSAQPQVLLFDDFNRPDGPIGTAPTGQSWVIRWGGPDTRIENGTFVPAGAIAMADCGDPNVDVRLVLASTPMGEIVVYFHASATGLGGSFWYAPETSTWNVDLLFVNRSNTDPEYLERSESTSGNAPVSGDTLRLVLASSVVRAYHNDTLLITTDYSLPDGATGFSYHSDTYYGVYAESPDAIDSITVTAL